MKCRSLSKKFVIVLAMSSVPMFSFADGNINDPALIQARQSYQVAKQNQNFAQQSVNSTAASQQGASAAANDAQNRLNDALRDLQRVVDQSGGDVNDVQQKRDQVAARLQQIGQEISNIQFNVIPMINQRVAATTSAVIEAQNAVGAKQAVVVQRQGALNSAQGAANQAQAALQPLQNQENSDLAQMQGAQQQANAAQSELNADQSALAAATSRLSGATNQITATNNDIVSQNQQIKGHQDKIDWDNGEIAVWRANPNPPSHCPGDRNCGHPQNAINNLQTDVHNQGIQMGPNQQKLNADQASLGQLNAQVAGAQSQIAQANQAIPQAQNKKANADQGVNVIRTRMQAREQQMAPYQNALNQRNAEVATRGAELGAAQEDLRQANILVDQRRQGLAKANQDLQEAQHSIADDQDFQRTGPQILADMDRKMDQLRDAHRRVDFASNANQQAQTALQQAQSGLDSSNAQLSSATTLVASAASALDGVVTNEPVVYGQGAGGISLTDNYLQGSLELSAALSGPDANNLGLTAYGPGISILWGAADGSNVGSEALVLRSANPTTGLPGYAGTLGVPAVGAANALTLAIGQSVALNPTDAIPGQSLIEQIYSAYEVTQTNATPAIPVSCVKTLACNIQSVNGYIVLVLPSAVLVIDPTSNNALKTIGLLNQAVLSTAGVRSQAINMIASQ